MRPHPRIRKTIKWGGLIAAALLSVAYVGTYWFYAMWESPTGAYVYIGSGLFATATPLWSSTPGSADVWWFEWNFYGMGWWFDWSTSGPGFFIQIPLWLALLLIAIPTALAWRLDTLATRRAKLGACPTCSYPRTGLAPSAPCPECGPAAPQA